MTSRESKHFVVEVHSDWVTLTCAGYSTADTLAFPVKLLEELSGLLSNIEDVIANLAEVETE